MRRYRTLRPLAIVFLTTALGACGTRGPLFLPPVQSKPANSGHTTTTPTKAPASPSDTASATNVPTSAADLNTPQKSTQ